MQEKIEFEIKSGAEGTRDSSEPSCIRIGTRILNYRWNVCRYFVVDARGTDGTRVYGSRWSIDIGTLLRENKQREVSRGVTGSRQVTTRTLLIFNP